MTPGAAGAGSARAAPSDSVVEGLAEDMADRWRAGDRPLAEEFLDRVPALWRHPDAALELIAEELTLRDEYRVPTTPAELAARFPRWPAQVAALLDCQGALGGRLAGPQFPLPGDRLGDFDLRAELGRGLHGRVFLATQPDLAGRPVVLKVGPDVGEEHLSLARLQHTHIVPLYSVHEFPDRNVRALCLPYFGGATLADLQARLGSDAGSRPPTGGDLLGVLQTTASPDVEPQPPSGPAWGFLDRATLADAACWIGACLADALQYAHDRGLLHLDLKPSNVLVAADGVPMLLDFHLARPPLAAGEPSPDWLGGTPGYMAPEHVAALDAVRGGRPVPAAVDARSDVFSLGVVLGEFLRATGCGVSHGLADVLARCTAAAPAARYPTAGDVAADLRRHLSDLPLKGVGNRSVAERWRKWRRRRPYAFPLALTLLAAAAAAAGLAAQAGRVADRADGELRTGRAHAADGRYAAAADAFRAGEVLTDGLPFYPALRADLRAARRDAERAGAAETFHAAVETLRVSAAADTLSAGAVRETERGCRDLWDRRDALVAGLSGQPTTDLDRRWRDDLLDVAVLSADLAVRAAPAPKRDDARQAAMTTLDEAERLFGPGRVTELERARHARAVGLTTVADAAARRADSYPARGVWDRVTAGRSYLAAGEVERAGAEFDAALRADPQSLWANHYRGVCALRLGRPVDAVAAFAAAVALAPRAPWCLYNRGLAYAEAGRPVAAVADFDQVITLDPGFAAAYLGRAAARLTDHPADALADLDRAAAAGAPPEDVLYRKAVVANTAHDRPAAVRYLRECLTHAPDYAAAKQLLDALEPAR